MEGTGRNQKILASKKKLEKPCGAAFCPRPSPGCGTCGGTWPSLRGFCASSVCARGRAVGPHGPLPPFPPPPEERPSGALGNRRRAFSRLGASTGRARRGAAVRARDLPSGGPGPPPEGLLSPARPGALRVLPPSPRVGVGGRAWARPRLLRTSVPRRRGPGRLSAPRPPGRPAPRWGDSEASATEGSPSAPLPWRPRAVSGSHGLPSGVRGQWEPLTVTARALCACRRLIPASTQPKTGVLSPFYG